MYDTILTHSGKAHRDEFLAICVALAHFDSIKTVKRVSSIEDLSDPSTLILDIGGGAFDHHQLSRNAKPEFAFGLLLRNLGLLAQFENQPWFSYSRIMDSKGPMAAAKSIGMDAVPPALSSPVEAALLAIFSRSNWLCGAQSAWDDEDADPDPLFTTMREIGRELIAKAEELAKNCIALDADIQVFILDGLYVIQTECPNLDGLDVVLARRGIKPAIRVTCDMRGEGWALYRYNDNPRIDFSQLANHADVGFAHNGGFYATTTSKLEINGLQSLLKAAIIPAG